MSTTPLWKGKQKRARRYLQAEFLELPFQTPRETLPHREAPDLNDCGVMGSLVCCCLHCSISIEKMETAALLMSLAAPQSAENAPQPDSEVSPDSLPRGSLTLAPLTRFSHLDYRARNRHCGASR